MFSNDERHFHRYNIEPFFFSSSANWIPSRYQEGAITGDSICIDVYGTQEAIL
ncbi:hypothetical protein EDB19DRAFT_1664722, partial [Suillus lakei]